MTDTEDQCEITIIFDSDKFELISIAAGMSDRTVPDFIWEAAFDKAIRTVLTDKVTFLSDEAYQAVCDSILQYKW